MNFADCLLPIDFLSFFEDGICSGFVNQYPNVEECGYEAGDCDDFNAKYPNCTFKRGWYDGLVVNQIGGEIF